MQPTLSSEDTIQVYASAEYTPIKTVIMCLANPFRTSYAELRSLLNPAVLRQIANNRWVPYNVQTARAQQNALIKVFKRHDIQVLFVDNVPTSATQHYTRDIGFVIEETFFPARMGTAYRAVELKGLDPLLKRFSKVTFLDEGRIEGGDVMLHEGMVLVGLSEASDIRGVNALRMKLEQLGIDRRVVPIEFTHGGVIHLDTKFNIVAKQLALINRKVFTPATVRWFERHFELIDVSAVETRALAVNTVACGNGRVIMDRANQRLADKIANKGLIPILIDYSEVTKLPGSFRCTTLPVERAIDT